MSWQFQGKSVALEGERAESWIRSVTLRQVNCIVKASELIIRSFNFNGHGGLHTLRSYVMSLAQRGQVCYSAK